LSGNSRKLYGSFHPAAPWIGFLILLNNFIHTV